MEKIITKNMKKIITRRPNGSKRVQTFITAPSLTDQQWQEDTDINRIMNTFEKTGQLRHLSSKQGVYADVSQVPDLLTASTIVKGAQELFDSLGSRVRERFHNNPQEMINFLRDPQNHEEAVKYGLMTKKEVKNDDNSNDDDKKPLKTKKPSSQPAPSES